jgi:riboflavin synthase
MKGSVALDGISLTVAGVNDHSFDIAVIPLTGEDTTLIMRKPGDIINIECDVLAKYIEKLMLSEPVKKGQPINYDFLTKHGYTD